VTDFNSTGIVQHNTIASSGTYAITASGAQGGQGYSGGGGLGAKVTGDIVLAAGTVLEIVVGAEGGNSTGQAGGGGGGSFVIETDNGTSAVDIILAVAGGGGGGSSQGGGGGSAAVTGGSGGGNHAGSGGGADAAGDGGGTGYGGGGGGFTGGAGGGGGNGSVGATSFSGGAASYSAGAGGFGGGGGGYGGGGGGGGYGGGGGGGQGSGSAGGGGGSYLDSSFTATSKTGSTRSGDGFVSIDDVSCFLEGTRIATPAGERAVESLGIGDLVTTADGRSAAVRWVGRRTMRPEGENGYRFADPLVYLPIRIRAGALGQALPRRDLLLSTDHAVLIDGLLVQAGALVNGVSVLRQTRLPETFTYYHIELPDHALVLAEGAPAETFVDNVTRMGFDNWAEHEALYGNEPSIAEMPWPRVQSRRQMPMELRERMDDYARALSTGVEGLLAA
jgi:hypothetical protein